MPNPNAAGPEIGDFHNTTSRSANDGNFISNREILSAMLPSFDKRNEEEVSPKHDSHTNSRVIQIPILKTVPDVDPETPSPLKLKNKKSSDKKHVKNRINQQIAEHNNYGG